MGVFNTIYFACPHCGEEQEEQYKPGSMKSWMFPHDVKLIPLEYLNSFRDRGWVCWSCDEYFRTDVNVTISIDGAKIEKGKS